MPSATRTPLMAFTGFGSRGLCQSKDHLLGRLVTGACLIVLQIQLCASLLVTSPLSVFLTECTSASVRERALDGRRVSKQHCEQWLF